jgi:hypothetical protein
MGLNPMNSTLFAALLYFVRERIKESEMTKIIS